jgi:hypothetical protein
MSLVVSPNRTKIGPDGREYIFDPQEGWVPLNLWPMQLGFAALAAGAWWLLWKISQKVST